jgi:hypothetical protein
MVHGFGQVRNRPHTGLYLLHVYARTIVEWWATQVP